tara:strand:- start:137 stop:436 length:300 start_codon:yes stop_codon:yes gene_type:complete
MNKGTVTTLVMANGAEIIGKFVGENSATITLNRPRMLQATQQGVGLVNGICMSGIEPDGDFDFSRSSVMFTIQTAPELSAGYMKQTTGIELPVGSGLIK